MKTKNTLSSDFTQLYQLYKYNLQVLINLASESKNTGEFKKKLQKHVIRHSQSNDTASRHILRLINYDGQTVYDLSTEKTITIQTMDLFYKLLKGSRKAEKYTDLFLDLYHAFIQLEKPETGKPDTPTIRQWMERWPSGNDPGIQAIREKNKERILHQLIAKIEQRPHSHPLYTFSGEESREEKYKLVKKWWNESRFHLTMAIKTPTELNRFLENSLPEETMQWLIKAKKKGMPFFITPYYLSLLNTTPTGYNDEAIRSYILYSPNLVKTYGNIRAWEKEESVTAGEPNAAGWLLPEGHNIHRRYPDVAILIPDSMGRACGGLCASCQRMYGFQTQLLNFKFESLLPKENWNKKLRRLMNYFEEDTQLRDILITGGDAFMSQNKTLRNILEAVYKMAVRKRKANCLRKEGEKWAELQRVRLGSRLPAYLPMRINDELIEILKDFHQKGSAIGIRQFIIQTHFQTPLEMTPEARESIRKILSAGWIITNQLVYTVAASRRGHTAKLRQVLNQEGIICYYTFSVKGFEENYEVFAPNSRSLQEQQEEKHIGTLSDTQEKELIRIFEKAGKEKKDFQDFLTRNNLPFLATDRNVMNLPALGKSMSFVTVGITEEGKRILRFDHDPKRKHSPLIQTIGKIYITENKSIRAYLKQLEQLGENPTEYAGIWNYTQGHTESRFKGFEYPKFNFKITKEFSNLKIDLRYPDPSTLLSYRKTRQREMLSFPQAGNHKSSSKKS